MAHPRLAVQVTAEDTLVVSLAVSEVEERSQVSWGFQNHLYVSAGQWPYHREQVQCGGWTLSA